MYELQKEGTSCSQRFLGENVCWCGLRVFLVVIWCCSFELCVCVPSNFLVASNSLVVKKNIKFLSVVLVLGISFFV